MAERRILYVYSEYQDRWILVDEWMAERIWNQRLTQP